MKDKSCDPNNFVEGNFYYNTIIVDYKVSIVMLSVEFIDRIHEEGDRSSLIFKLVIQGG